MKNTWRYFINNDKNHEFKCYKVLIAFQWYESEQIDKRGVPNPTDKTNTIFLKTNFAGKYTDKYK